MPTTSSATTTSAARTCGGDPDAGVRETTGILVYSSGQPTTVTISHNLIFNNHFGIWLSSATVRATMNRNVFLHDAVKIENL